MILQYFKLAGVALIVFATWYVTSDHYQKRIAEIQLQTAAAVQTQLLEHEKNLKLAGEQHAKDQLRNTDLARQLSRVQVSGICSSTVPNTGKDTDGGAGTLSTKVDTAFASLQSGVGDLLARCDQLNTDAIQANNSR